MFRLQVNPEIEALLHNYGLNNNDALMHFDAGQLAERAQDAREVGCDGQSFSFKRIYRACENRRQGVVTNASAGGSLPPRAHYLRF